MEDKDILQYFNENASKEDWEVVQKLYTYELTDILKELSILDKESFSLAELIVIYIRCAVERDLDHIKTVDNEIGNGSNESAVEMYMGVIKELLEGYEQEDKEGR